MNTLSVNKKKRLKHFHKKENSPPPPQTRLTFVWNTTERNINLGKWANNDVCTFTNGQVNFLHLNKLSCDFYFLLRKREVDIFEMNDWIGAFWGTMLLLFIPSDMNGMEDNNVNVNLYTKFLHMYKLSHAKWVL